MSISREARRLIIDQFIESPKRSKKDLLDMISPHYVPDYKKLAEQDMGRLANRIASTIKDETGARNVFAVDSDGERCYINVDESDNIKDVRNVYRTLVKGRDCRDKSIEKVLKRGKELAEQLSLDFG
ncbi:hypothetical protein [Anaeromusa sp.]|uniref:hypothetical protein n=1 Tax=Anaeromusa sp. TaxID=1872520 RepID=UPI002613F86D|nr:hypothetical protein [Anaeromusa sp.]MDD3157473.1 hypothetical protein [Anaeromusa sp.]